MKVKVNYDYTQQELVGERDVFAGKKKGIDTAYKTTLVNNQLNGCVVFITV